MKCELIAALLHRPKILFLDEPTIGLDIVVQKRIREFFKEYNSDKKTTIILTSHYMDDVSELCERIIVINKGTKVYDGKLSDLILKHAPYKVLKLVFNEHVKKAELEKFGSVTNFDNKGYFAELSVDRKDHTKIAGTILNQYKVDDLDISEVGLEEIIGNIFRE
jgi:ABC-2 type transport system ATP-binding protein